MEPQIRVFIADQRPVIRAGLRAYLSACDELFIVGECAELSELRAHTETTRPDVVLVGHPVHLLDWTGLVDRYLASGSTTRCLLLCQSDLKPIHYANAFRAGFRGVFLKTSELETLRTAIKTVHEGKLWCDEALTGNLLNTLINGEPEREILSQLSERQRKIVQLVLKGEGNQEIAQHLFASEATIARDLTLTYRKLNVSSRVALITRLQGEQG